MFLLVVQRKTDLRETEWYSFEGRYSLSYNWRTKKNSVEWCTVMARVLPVITTNRSYNSLIAVITHYSIDL